MNSNTSPASQHRSSTLLLGLLGAALCYLAHPPVGWGLLAWIGPVPWILLARCKSLPGKRPYVTLWLAGSCFWLATIQWIRLPHPGNHVAWLLLSFYLGAYLPSFIALTRVLRRVAGVPVWAAAPIAWTGLELLRAHLFTGFLMASLAHTQVSFPLLLQVARLAGEYGVTFLIVLVAGAIAEAAPIAWIGDGDDLDSQGGRLLKLAPASVALVAATAYGALAIRARDADPAEPTVRIALVQSDLLADWKGDAQRDRNVMIQQAELSQAAVDQSAEIAVDLVVWPETMFRVPLFTLDETFGDDNRLLQDPLVKEARLRLSDLATTLNTNLLVGIDRGNILSERSPIDQSAHQVEHYNSSVFCTADGEITGFYDKMHLLPFGEYIPFANWLPLLASTTPITGSAVPGEAPTAMTAGGVVYAVNICYETVLPHLIRRHVVELARQGNEPDVLVNLTNDAWYWGSAELDMHLASGVMRAVETETPLVVAANRGLSTHIDSSGRIVQVSQRDIADFLLADVAIDPRRRDGAASLTPYARFGDWLPITCLFATLAAAVIAWRKS